MQHTEFNSLSKTSPDFSTDGSCNPAGFNDVSKSILGFNKRTLTFVKRFSNNQNLVLISDLII